MPGILPSPGLMGGRKPKSAAAPSRSKVGSSAVGAAARGGDAFAPRFRGTGHLAGTPGGALITPEYVREIQRFLQRKGYQITADGIAGPLTKAALRDYLRPDAQNPIGPSIAAILGLGKRTVLPPGPRKPGAFNARFGPHHSVVFVQPNHAGVVVPPHPASGGGIAPPPPHPKSHAPAAPSSDPITALLRGLNPSIGETIPTDLADTLAGTQYDASINALNDLIGQLPKKKAQALHDVDAWFGQVLGSLATATAKDKALGDAGTSSLADATKAIVSSLGGAANPGSYNVAQTGENAAGTQAAITQSQLGLDNELAPIFRLSAAGAKSRAAAQFDQQGTDLRQQLMEAVSGRGSAKAQALLSIIGSNNDLAQKNFGNKLSILQALEAAALVPGQNAAQQALIKERLAHAAKDNRPAPVKPAPGSYAAASSKAKTSVFQTIVQSIASGPGQLQSGVDWPTALRTARNIVRSNGWDPLNPAIVSEIIGPALTQAGVQFPMTVLTHP